MTTSPLLGPLLQAFFADYLLTQKRASPRTVAAYRDCFRPLLKALHEATKTQPCAMRLSDLDAPAILSFLDSLEQKRGNSVRSRNARLAAIRGFFRYVSFREPESIYLATRVLSIPVKRTTHKLVGYLSRAEVEAILDAPDQSSWSGRRDLALLLTLYNSGGRVSEITALKRTQVSFGSTTFIHLLGKGRKERTVPLWSKTARVLQTWFREIDSLPGDIAFPNARGRALSRYGVNYLIDRATNAASAKCLSLKTKVVSSSPLSSFDCDASTPVRCRHSRHRPVARPRVRCEYPYLCTNRSSNRRTRTPKASSCCNKCAPFPGR